MNASSPGTPVLAPTQAYTTFHPFETGSTWWTPVPGAATYVWETSQGDPNFGWNNVFRQDNLDQTAFTFDMGFEGTFYSRVYAVSADGIRGVPSNVISYTYSYNNPIGPPPALLSPISGQTVTLPVTLQWAHVPNPQVFGYTVEIAKDPAFKNIEDTEVQQHFPSVPIDSLTPGTKYWRVFSTQGDQRARHGRLRRLARRHRAVGDRHVHGQHGACHAGVAGARGRRLAAGRARRHQFLRWRCSSRRRPRRAAPPSP